MATGGGGNDGDENDHDDGNGGIDPYFSTLESVMRISLAGFGGALAGLSLARRGGGRGGNGVVGTLLHPPSSVASTSGVVGKKNNNGGRARLRRMTAIRASPPESTSTSGGGLLGGVDRDLPAAWATACAAFAGVVEFVRVVSPSTALRDLLVDVVDRVVATTSTSTSTTTSSSGGGNDGEEAGSAKATITTPTATTTKTTTDGSFFDPSTTALAVADYAIGGAIAGAIFRGSAVRTRAGSRFDASSSSSSSSSIASFKPRRSMTSGMLPGAALGLSAGILIASLDRARVLLEEEYGRGRNVRLDDEDDDDDENDDDDDVLSTDGLDPSSSAVIRDGGGDGPIPDDIRAMSNEELARSIEILRGRGDRGGGWSPSTMTSSSSSAEPSRSKDVETTADESGDVRDLFTSIGFRPHPSREEE